MSKEFSIICRFGPPAARKTSRGLYTIDRVKLMNRLEIKKIKTFNGMEGVGLNATLYFDGKKVCEVLDEGCGGTMTYHWTDGADHNSEIAKQVREYVSTLPTKYVLTGMTAEWLFDNPTQERADLLCPKCGKSTLEITEGNFKGYTFCKPCNADTEVVGNTLDSFVNAAVDNDIDNKRFKRMCKTGTVVVQGGVYSKFSVVFSPETKKRLLEKHPDITEFVNERYK